MNNYLKASLLLTSAFTLVALPVAAGHKSVNLRGMAPAQMNYGTPTYHTSAPNGYVPSWQTQRLQSNYGQPQVAYQGQYQGQHQVQGEYIVYDTAQAPMYQTAQARPKFMTRALNKIGLRGFSNKGQVRHSPQAAQDFRRKRAPQFNLGGPVKTNAAHTREMLDWQESVTGKTITLLANRANGQLQDDSLYIGGGIRGGFMFQSTSQAGQFPLLSRFPFFSNRTDKSAGVFAINNAALSFTSTFGDWTTIYMQPEYSETEYAPDQEEFQLRKAFVVFGNLEKTPFYAAFGRKTIDFGNFDSYNAFTHNEGAHYFHAVSDQPVLEVGYYGNGFKVSASALSGGRQLRVAFANEDNNLANYAFNAEKEFLIGKNKAFTLGGGYLHDTIYRDNFTAHTFQGRQTGTPPANFIEYRNSAVNAFAEYNSPFFDAMVEYTTTLKPWAAAIPQSTDGTPVASYLIDPNGSTTDINNINFDEKLSVLVAQARIKPMVFGNRLAIAATGSWGNIGDDFVGVGAFGQPTTWSKNQQHAFSLEYPISPYLEVGAEYVYNKGFIPFVAPQQVSNDSTTAHAVNVGFKARF